jgi:hypothetical protein
MVITSEYVQVQSNEFFGTDHSEDGVQCMVLEIRQIARRMSLVDLNEAIGIQVGLLSVASNKLSRQATRILCHRSAVPQGTHKLETLN